MGTPLYRHPKTSHWGPNQQLMLLSVDRPVDRPTVKFLTVEPAVDRPVDRGTGTESRALCRSTGAFQRAEALCSRPSRSTGPPAVLACTSVDRPGRPTSSSVDRSGRPAEARTDTLKGLKGWYFDTNKIP